MKKETATIKIQPHSNWFNILVNFGLTALFSAWAALFYPYFAAKYNLVQLNQETGLTVLTSKGKLIALIISTIYVLIMILYNFYHNKNTKIITKSEFDDISDKLENYKSGYSSKCAEVDLFKEIEFFDRTIAEHKYSNLQNALNWVVQQNENPYCSKIISLPEDQIKCILQEMVHSFSKICEIEKSIVDITACYKTDGDWQWITGCEPHGSVGFTELRNSPSMFTILETGNDNYLFYNNKIEAHDNNQYVYDGEEDDGSIIGRKVIVKDKNNNTRITLMYFLATYNGHHITESEKDIKKIKNMLSENLFRYIDIRLRTEMILWFINTYSS